MSFRQFIPQIDLYWDKTFVEEQKEAFRTQINWAKELQIPIVIHARDSFPEIYEVLDRENDEKTSAVHFVRFEFTAPMRAAIQAGAGVKLGCDHTHYPAHGQLSAETLASLAGDLK